MGTPPVSDDEVIRRVEEFAKHKTQSAAAKALRISRQALQASLQEYNRRGLSARTASILSNYRYDTSRPEKTKTEAWGDHVSALERKVGNQLAKSEFSIKKKGPFVIFHATDEHVDDDASALNILEADIQASHDMGAIMCHGGDLLNNWPMAGRLAKKWAEQSCTLPDALLRAQHFIDIFKPDFWVDGNHEEMNPYLMDMFSGWLPKKTMRDYWRIDFTVKVDGCQDYRVALSHKFQKGNSWFHALHGPIREMLQSEERNLYMDGHYHQDGVMFHSLPERGHTALLVASAGYKLIDSFGARISRGGKIPKILGRAHWIVTDTRGDDIQHQAFKSPEHAQVYFGALQNLREV